MTLYQMNETVSLVSAYYKNEALTHKFLNHLAQYATGSTELILVNAGSEPISHPTVTTSIYLPDNQSFSNSMNAGIRAASGEYTLLLGNDVFPTDPLWIPKLIALQQRTGAWIVAPSNDNPGLDAYTTRYTHQVYKDYVAISMFPAICWLMPRSTIDRIGLFDERFKPGCYEDDDYALRTAQAGGTIVVAKDVIVHHELSQTLQLFDMQRVLEENQIRFRAKWGEVFHERCP